jgi:uncharacterized protein YcnI
MHRTFFAALLAAICLTAAVSAHVTMAPRQSEAGAEQTYTIQVHTDSTVPTASIELEIPAGVHVTNVAAGEGTFEVKKEQDRIVSITWTREIKPKQSAKFTFTAHNPASGTLQWKTHQTFTDGSTRHWIGDRGKKEPAPVTTIVPKGTKPTTPADADHKH